MPQIGILTFVICTNFKPFRSFSLFLLIISIIIAALSMSMIPSSAQTPQELATNFAPVLHFTGGEKFYPTSADYIISSSVLKSRNADGTSALVTSNPTPSNLGSYTGTSLFLSSKLDTLDAIVADYALNASSVGYYAYVHVVTSGSYKVIQYWLFYAYNNGPLNDHQSDIEVIQIFLDSSNSPVKALFSQHGAGENAVWGDVEKSDTHPVVYVAQGSHANYFRAYQGKIGIENDVVGSDGKTINPDDLRLVMLGERNSHPASQSWLDFAGRWGFWGTDEDVALGRAGPLGPVFNQDGTRWAQPLAYLDTTLGVNGNYFILAWFAANFLLLFVIYVVIRAAWKVWGIVKLHRKGGLLVMKFLKSRGGPSLILGVVAIFITVFALALPWYIISASSQAGPLAKQGGVTLLTIDGISGMQVNLFLGSGGDSTSGYSGLFFMQMPFAMFIAVGLVLLALDVVGVKNGKSLGLKLILGAIVSLLPFILILVFIVELPAFLPWASQLVPGQTLPSEVGVMVNAVAGSPVVGSASQQFPVVGATMVSWGFGVGAYLFVVATVMRIIAGFMMRSVPELQEKPAPPAKTVEKKLPPAASEPAPVQPAAT